MSGRKIATALLLGVVRVVSTVLNVRLVPDVNAARQNSTSAAHQLGRSGVTLDTVKTMLVFIEDRAFYQHIGVGLKASFRASLSLAGLKRRSGGSTITQQLVRTLFIQDLRKVYRRKIVEMLLAVWFECGSTKAEILDQYLASVRFAEGAYGIIQAMTLHFSGAVATPSRAQAFFLVERVSNVRPVVIASKVDDTLQQAVRRGIMGRRDASELIDIYVRFVDSGILSVNIPDAFARLRMKWA